MKYLITESQIDKVIFKYLNHQDFTQIEKNNNIYFVNSEDDKYAQIRYDKSDGWCYIDNKLIKKISSFFSLQRSDSKQVISRWVENTLQMKVIEPYSSASQWRKIVENTPSNKNQLTL